MKIVIRDYDDRNQRAFVVTGDGEHASEYRIPSCVAVGGGRLLFGWKARDKENVPGWTVIDSIKIKTLVPNRFTPDERETNCELTLAEVATLVVAAAIQLVHVRATAYCARHGAVPVVSTILGAPVGVLDKQGPASDCVRMARLGAQVARVLGNSLLEDGMDVRDAQRALKAAELRVAEMDRAAGERGRVFNPADWVRSEEEAAIHWVFFDARFPTGLYATIDIGAGTTSATVFKKCSFPESMEGMLRGISFYSGVTRPPAADDVGRILGEERGYTLSQVRGRENEIIQQVADRRAVNGVAEEILSIYAAAYQTARPKEYPHEEWAKQRVFVLGGGGRIKALRDVVGVNMATGRRAVERVPSPEDLIDEQRNRFAGEGDFLFIAQGLSRRERLEIEYPSEVGVHEPPRVYYAGRSGGRRGRPDVDELYPK